MEDALNNDVNHSGEMHGSTEEAVSRERQRESPDADNDHQKEIPTGSCWCPKNIEGDLVQRVENLESSLNVKQSDSLSDAIQTAESTKEGFPSL